MAHNYENGKEIKLGDYVRINRPEFKNFWGMVQAFIEPNIVEILDRKGKIRQALSTECTRVINSKLNKLKYKSFNTVIIAVSEDAKRKRRI